MKEKIWDYMWLMISSILIAFAVKFFFQEYSLTPGGITGLAITISSVTNIPIAIISPCISIPMLIISTYFYGGQFGIKTLFVVLTSPIFLKIIPQTHVVNNILLAAIFGGVLVGLSITITIWKKCATGGTDVIAKLLQLIFKKVELPVILFCLDMAIVLSSWMISKNMLTSVFSALSLFIIMQTIKRGTKLIKDHEK